MTPDQYDRVREIFLQARERAGPDRRAYLDQVCTDDQVRGEVESLLAHDEDDAFLDGPAIGADFVIAGHDPSSSEAAPARPDEAAPDPGNADHPSLPSRIGRYRILDVLGVGGMGVVYYAEQINPKRPVALKVIRPGAESREMLRRFEYEGQVLGWLQHPGIAQVFEAGTSDTGHGPQPFFAMELVRGQRLGDYAHAHRLTTRARLALMANVCDAVHHAHQKGVIHRDLKPGNILVDENGQPKILDFGVARATNADIRTTTLRTDAGQLVGTIAYMSPEQVRGDSSQLDTRSDVYALGIILYELLCGRLPQDVANMTIPQAARVIAEDDPQPISSIDRAFRGDVSSIVTKALEKDKNRRYQSASDLAHDIRCYLSDQPIMARPVTTLYQLRKFARRHRPLVAAVAIVTVALSVAVVVLTVERNRAVAAEERAERHLQQVETEAAKTREVNRFFNRMLVSASPDQKGRDVRVVDILERASQSVGTDLTDQPEVEASLRNTIGTVYIGLGLYQEAEPYLRRAVETREAVLGPEHPDTLVAMTNLAKTLKELGRLEEAATLTGRTLEIRRRTYGLEHVRTLDSMNIHAEVLFESGRLEEAETLWRETLAVQRRVLEPDSPTRLITTNNLALLVKQMRRPEEAEPLLREAVALFIAVQGEEHPNTLGCMNNLANTLRSLGRYEEAEEQLRRIVAIRRRTLGSHPALYSSISNLARVLQDSGRFEEAEPLFRESWEGMKATLGPEHRSSLSAQNNLATVWVDLGRSSEADPLYRDLIATAKRVLPARHWIVLVFERNHGRCLVERERFAEAEALLLPALDGLKTALGPDHEHTHKTHQYVVRLYEAWGRMDEADRWRDRTDPVSGR